jgi:HEAT repeat protein
MTIRAVSWVAAVLLMAGSPVPASAQNKRRPPVPDVRVAEEKLKSTDPGRVLEGLTEAKANPGGSVGFAPLIEELLKKGASLEVAKAAIEALGAIGRGSSSAAIRPYTQHRSGDLRHAAVVALASTGGAESTIAFRDGLRQSDAFVRDASARGLGQTGAKEAIGDLFLALERGVSAAAPAIGTLCGPDDCVKLAGRVGPQGAPALAACMDPVFFRKVALPDETLATIVGALRALGTKDASAYLASVLSRWPKKGSQKVHEALAREGVAAPWPPASGARP